MATQTLVERLEARALAPNITSVQPGGGWIMQLELAWGKLRRWWLRRFRSRYVADMQAARRGECPGCPHDIVDSRDLKFYQNVCGFSFAPQHDRFRWRGRLGVARLGWAEILSIGGILAILAGGMVCLAAIVSASWIAWLAILPASLAVFVVAFFRDPVRRIPDTPGAIVAPADGTVDDIEEIAQCEFLDGPAVKIGIFLSVFNVHINRAPESSRVIDVQYFAGKFGNAMYPSVARKNEQVWLALEEDRPPHRRMLVKQIAGAIARRIVCQVRPGEVLTRGQKFGMIKFGSRTELYLPKEDRLCIEAKQNQRVRGGSSILARYRDLEGAP